MTSQPRVWFSNYDYGTGKDEKGGPGKGLFTNLDHYKSVKEFLDKKRKRKKTKSKKMALLIAALFPELVKGKKYASQDPYEDQDITPLAPISPAETGGPIGMLDGIYPESDTEGKTIDNLGYGRQESHEYAAKDGYNEEPKEAKHTTNKKT